MEGRYIKGGVASRKLQDVSKSRELGLQEGGRDYCVNVLVTVEMKVSGCNGNKVFLSISLWDLCRTSVFDLKGGLETGSSDGWSYM